MKARWRARWLNTWRPIITSSTGFETLAEAEAAVLAVDYDFILLDLHLPDGDGLALLDMMRDRLLRVPGDHPDRT